MNCVSTKKNIQTVHALRFEPDVLTLIIDVEKLKIINSKIYLKFISKSLHLFYYMS